MSIFAKLKEWFHEDAVAPFVAFEAEVQARLTALEEKVGLRPPEPPAAPPQ